MSNKFFKVKIRNKIFNNRTLRLIISKSLSGLNTIILDLFNNKMITINKFINMEFQKLISKHKFLINNNYINYKT
jgi:hypothetical protein